MYRMYKFMYNYIFNYCLTIVYNYFKDISVCYKFDKKTLSKIRIILKIHT